jgi:hypothetical protein
MARRAGRQGGGRPGRPAIRPRRPRARGTPLQPASNASTSVFRGRSHLFNGHAARVAGCVVCSNSLRNLHRALQRGRGPLRGADLHPVPGVRQAQPGTQFGLPRPGRPLVSVGLSDRGLRQVVHRPLGLGVAHRSRAPRLDGHLRAAAALPEPAHAGRLPGDRAYPPQNGRRQGTRQPRHHRPSMATTPAAAIQRTDRTRPRERMVGRMRGWPVPREHPGGRDLAPIRPARAASGSGRSGSLAPNLTS